MSPVSRPRATIVVPCAGGGRRLAIPHPKELVPLGPNEVLIDRTFGLFESIWDRVHVIVVTAPEKLETVKYLQRYADRTSLAFVYQSPDRPGLYGAVRAALPWCERYVVVLLPDELVELDPSRPNPIGDLIDALEDHPVAFLAAAESDRGRMARDGALAVDAGGRVTAYADKAGIEAALDVCCNAIWTGFGFEREAADALLDVMEAAQGTGPLDASRLARSRIDGAATVPVKAVNDLGAWQGIYTHMARRASMSDAMPAEVDLANRR
jgi:hypothetical protein